MKRNLKLIIAYEGTQYCGWQKQGQSKIPTIQKVIEDAIFQILREKPKIIVSGRTDTGVHAAGQVANFITSSCLSLNKLLKGLNSILPDSIRIQNISEVAFLFHSRFNVKTKTYIYYIDNGIVPSIFYRKFAWHIPQNLNIDLMSNSAKILIGDHDFTSFCATRCKPKTYIRKIIKAIFFRNGSIITFSIEGTGFLQYMIRNILGTLVYVGLKKITVENFKSILDAKNRILAGPTAPSKGLILKRVNYN